MVSEHLPSEELPESLPADIELRLSMNRSQRIYVSWLVDILVYIVVLNLYVEYSEAKVIDSFTVSVLTAMLLKLLLVLITAAKYSVWGWAKSKEGRGYKVVGALGVWAILFLSKFVILEAVVLVFGDSVELGSFIDVMLLAVGLMAARELVHRIFARLGSSPNRT